MTSIFAKITASIAVLVGLSASPALALAQASECTHVAVDNEGYVRALLQSQIYQIIENGQGLQSIDVRPGATCNSKVIQVRFENATTEDFTVTLDLQTYRYDVASSMRN